MRSGLALGGQVQHVAHISGGSHGDIGGFSSSAARVKTQVQIMINFTAKYRAEKIA